VSLADHLQSAVPLIISKYRGLLESSGSPLTATHERWQQCDAQAEAVLRECVDLVAGRTPRSSDVVQRTVEIGARRSAERISSTESVRAALFLWQAAVPVFRATLPSVSCDHTDGTSPLLTGLDALSQALMTRLLHEAVGYNDLSITREILASQERVPPQRVPSHGSAASPTASLTVREHEVLTCVAKAMTNYEIGRELGIAEATVKRHLRNVFTKLHATSRMDAIQKAGLVSRPESPGGSDLSCCLTWKSMTGPDRRERRKEP
jgi:DNA-binding CsgD family transcriptional regulator